MYYSFEATGKQILVHNYLSLIEGSLNANVCLWAQYLGKHLSSLREKIGLSVMKTVYQLSVVVLKQSYLIQQRQQSGPPTKVIF